MADKVHRIHSLPDDAPWTGVLPPSGSEEHPMFVLMLDRVLAIQRPVVLAHLRSIRLRHPDASTVEIVRSFTTLRAIRHDPGVSPSSTS